MKSFITFLTIIFILTGCSSNDEDPIQETPKDLVITSYSPTSAMAGDEITFVGENIDPTITYTVSFNGIDGETTSVTETIIVAIVPQDATTGEIIIKYDDKSLNVGELEIIEELPLIITSFSPDVAFSGDEVTFLGENIDPAIIYTVSFNGIDGETTSVAETEIVAVIPEGATSGEIVISYEDSTISVGTIEIIEELDKLYGYLPIEGAGCEALKIYNLDVNSGVLMDEIALLHNQSCYSYLSSNFYRDANIFVHTFTTRYGQGMPYGKACVIKNLTTGAVDGWTLSDGVDYDGSILAAHDNNIYYIYRNYVDVDETYEVRVINLDTGISNTLYEFPLDYTYDLKNSGFLPSTNELVFFTKDESNQPIFMKLNIETSVLTSHNISDSYSSIFVTSTERIFGIKANKIVEIDKTSGRMSSVLAELSGGIIQKIDYSVSSNRIFTLIKASNNQYLYKVNISDGTATKILLDEQNDHKDFYGIYLND